MAHGHPQTNPYRPYDFDSANKRYIESGDHQPDPIVGARSRVGIITCCDARCIPERFFQMEENEAFVLRNGGGRTAEVSVIRTILLIELLSEIKEIKVIHHTDCGSLAFTDEWVRDLVQENDPLAPGGPFKEGALPWAEAIAYQPFTGKPGDTERDKVETSVVQDVSYLRNHPLIKPSIKLTGYVYDLHSGRVEEVDCSSKKPTKNGVGSVAQNGV